MDKDMQMRTFITLEPAPACGVRGAPDKRRQLGGKKNRARIRTNSSRDVEEIVKVA